MLTRAIGYVVGAVLLPLLTMAPTAFADDEQTCPDGTDPVSVGSGVVCVVVVDPGTPGEPGDPGEPGEGGEEEVTQPAGCFKTDGTQVPCQTPDGYWWSGFQCYAAPYDAAPDDPAWQGHTGGSVWACTSCVVGPSTNTCTVRFIWMAPGEQPSPPTPEELATEASAQLPLVKAEIHTAPQAPAATYVGVENWLWIPTTQWASLSKSVTAGSTTVTVTAAPSDVVWRAGAKSVTCPGPGAVWTAGMTDAAVTTCSFKFQQTSVGQPDGVFAVTAVIRYHVTWSCAKTCSTASGDLGMVDAPAGTGEMTVLQRQTVVVQ